MNHYEPLISYLKWVVKIGYSNQVGWLIGTVKLDVNTMVNRLSHLWSVSFSWLEPYPNHPQMAMDSIGHLSGWLAPSPNINHSPYFYHPFSWEWSTDHPKKWWFFLGDGEKIDRPGMIFSFPIASIASLRLWKSCRLIDRYAEAAFPRRCWISRSMLQFCAKTMPRWENWDTIRRSSWWEIGRMPCPSTKRWRRRSGAPEPQ